MTGFNSSSLPKLTTLTPDVGKQHVGGYNDMHLKCELHAGWPAGADKHYRIPLSSQHVNSLGRPRGDVGAGVARLVGTKLRPP